MNDDLIELEQMEIIAGQVVGVMKKFKPTDNVTRFYSGIVGSPVSYHAVTRTAQEWLEIDRKRAADDWWWFSVMAPFVVAAAIFIVALNAGWLK